MSKTIHPNARTRFIGRATAGYALFAGLWIFFSDRALESFVSAETITRLSTVKGFAFIGVTALLLALALRSVPPEEDQLPIAQDEARRAGIRRRLLALAIPLVAFALQWGLWDLIKPSAWFLFFPAVFFSSWIGGVSGGVYGTIVSALLAWFFFIPPEQNFQLENPMSIFSIGLFVGMGMLFTLTHQRLRRAERQAAEAKYRILVEQSLAGIYIIQDGGFAYVNPRFAEIFGYASPGELIGRTRVDDLVIPEDRQRVRDNVERRLSGEIDAIRYDFTGVRRDGARIAVEVYGRAFLHRRRPAVIGLILDITERVAAEAALRRSEMLLRSIVEGTPDAVFVKDRQGRYRFINQAAARFVGRPVDEIVGQTDAALFPPESAALLMALDREVMAASAPRTHEENLTTLAGEQLTFLVTKGPLFDAAGEVDGLFGISHDISGRKRAEQALAANEAIFRQLAEIGSDYFWEHDEQFRFVAVSPSITTKSGLDYQQFIGHTRWEMPFLGIDAAGWAAHRALLEAHRPFRDLELGLLNRFGEERWFRISGDPIFAADGRFTGYRGVTQDITARRRAEEEVRTLNAELEQRVRQRTAELSAANAELDSFVYAVSHDLRAPLRAMSGFSQALVEDYGERLDGQAHKFLEQIVLASRKMGELIDGLLTLSRSTRSELRHDAVDLSALAGAILDEFARAEPARQVRRSIAPGLIAQGDARMLEAVMRNLLGNAWKYSGGETQAEIRVDRELHDGQPFFCVADNGAGFDMAHAGHLFQPFQRLHRQDEFPGLGIGLATVQRIVHRHGGEIFARAEKNRGATFCFSLPTHTGDSA